MLRVLIHNWWLLALRGVFAALLALFAFSMHTTAGTWLLSAMASAGLVVVFGILAIAAGLCTMAAAVRGAAQDRSHLLLADGIAICIGGGVILLAPRLDLAWLVATVAVLAMAVGVLEIMMARRLRRHIPDERILALSGAVSFFLGAYFALARPMQTGPMLQWLGVYAAFSAVAILALAFRLHSLETTVHELVQHTTSPGAK
jgi:uncharacterized membrane protein HdeD (DUF308 family)